jgi:hypothetical protein
MSGMAAFVSFKGMKDHDLRMPRQERHMPDKGILCTFAPMLSRSEYFSVRMNCSCMILTVPARNLSCQDQAGI